MQSIALQMSVLSVRERVHMLPKTVISSASNTYAEEVKAPWDFRTATWAAENGHLHILEYLIERKYDKYEVLCEFAAKSGQFRLFEVLA